MMANANEQKPAPTDVEKKQRKKQRFEQQQEQKKKTKKSKYEAPINECLVYIFLNRLPSSIAMFGCSCVNTESIDIFR